MIPPDDRRPDIVALQMRLLQHRELRERFHSEWKAERDRILAMNERVKSPIETAIKRTRDRWLDKERGDMDEKI